MGSSADVVVIGAGIAGVAAAHELAVNRRVETVVMVDPRPPLSLTSDKSTESYRNWWPDEPMIGLMNRSIEILNGFAYLSNNAFGLNRRGYLFVTGDEDTLDLILEQARATSSLGAGPLRAGDGSGGFDSEGNGADLLDRDALRSRFPYLTEAAAGGLFVRRAGWFDAQQLGAWMLERAQKAGARLIRSEVVGVEVEGDAVRAVALDDGSLIEADTVVNASGPLARDVGLMAGVDLPLFSELHLKVVFKDHLGAVPRDAPMLIWTDPQTLVWTREEREGLAARDRSELTRALPGFCHGRPEGGRESPYVVGLWEYDRNVIDPLWPIPIDDLYAEVVIRGLAKMVPGLGAYRDGLPEASVDGGYYTKTRENRPLIGPCGPEGFHVMVGLSGFGVMVAAGAAALLADHVTDAGPVELGSAFLLSRYGDDAYLAAMEGMEAGQL